MHIIVFGESGRLGFWKWLCGKSDEVVYDDVRYSERKNGGGIGGV
jgi:hypothetical protein